jgi:toxin ParE1/3/4
MLRYVFHPLAARELDEAVEYLEAISSGKGQELAEQVRAAIALIRQHPESAPRTRGAVRSIVVQPTARWHYTLHYRFKPGLIRILAVAHQRRQPFYWFGRR